METKHLGETNTRRLVIDEYRLHYKQLQLTNPDESSRISPLLPIPGTPVAISIIEREYEGSESYALMVYELVEATSNPFEPKQPIVRRLTSGEEVHCQQSDLLFTNTSSIDRLIDIAEEITRALIDD